MSENEIDPADRTVFVLDDEAWDAFQAELERPAKVLPKLQKLFAEKPVWED